MMARIFGIPPRDARDILAWARQADGCDWNIRASRYLAALA